MKLGAFGLAHRRATVSEEKNRTRRDRTLADPHRRSGGGDARRKDPRTLEAPTADEPRKPNAAQERLNVLLPFLDAAHMLKESLDGKTREEIGLRLGQAVVLCRIDRAGGRMRISDIAAAIGRANHTATSVVDTLERLSLVVRERSRQDRRAVLVVLTPKGDDWLARYRLRAGAILASLLVYEADDAFWRVIEETRAAIVRVAASQRS